MTLSLWRYIHLGLAIICTIFLCIASATGIILALHSIDEQIPSYRTENSNQMTLSQVLPVLQERYDEITTLTIDYRGFASIEAINMQGNHVKGYVDLQTGEIIGAIEKKSPFIQWITTLHRSLFLHEKGRILMGILSFLLFFIAFSGFLLIIKQQKNLRHFFSKIVKENFFQYYHSTVGRWTLIPIWVVALTGTYLSANRFLIPQNKISHTIDFEKITIPNERKKITDFDIFKSIHISEIRSIEFPFFQDDPEEYYLIKLIHKEIAVEQFSGEVVSEIFYPTSSILNTWSLNLHTGRTNILWAVILIIACISILFFIFSGFTITFSRKTIRIKNSFKPHNAEIVLLFGSEGGSTLHFASLLHKQLISNNQKSFLGELDTYATYPCAKIFLILTSTYGAGDAPSNAKKFLSRLKKIPQYQSIQYAIIGFGSKSYPDFCQFAHTIDAQLKKYSWAVPLLDIHTVDNQSTAQLVQWIKKWNTRTEIILNTESAFYLPKPNKMHSMKILEKTPLSEKDNIFSLTLQTRKGFTSGDLLAIYPQEQERLYSIGKIKDNIRLTVKLHRSGLGSNFLYNLTKGDNIRARIIKNPNFYFPKKKKEILLIANGTGIAPFLGMISQNKRQKCYLYAGFRHQTETIDGYEKFFQKQIEKKHLTNYQIAFSKEKNQCYVTDLLNKDADFVALFLQKGGIIMICGSMDMCKDVETSLEEICLKHTEQKWNFYKDNGQFLTDCY